MPKHLATEVSNSIMLGFSYMEAYSKNDLTREKIFEEAYTPAELKDALLLAFDQVMWAYALRNDIELEEYLAQMRTYLTNFTETVRTVKEDE